MKYLSKLIMLAWVSLLLPLSGYAHPDFDDKQDVQQVLHAMLLSVDTDTTPNNNKKLKFNDGRTYTVTIEKNFVINTLATSPKLVVRFEKAAALIQLLTLESKYTPKFSKFSKLLELLEEAIAHNKFKLKLAIELAKDAKAIDSDKFSEVAAQILGADPADDAALTTALKSFGEALLADIKAKKKADKLGDTYNHHVHDLFEGLNNRDTVRKVGLPKEVNGAYIQRYKIKVNKSATSTFTLTDQAFAKADVIGDTATTGGGGGGTPTNTNSDIVQKLKTESDLLFKNSSFLGGYAPVVAAGKPNDRDLLTRGVIVVGIELSKQARDAAAAAVAANEPNAAQAQTQATAIRTVITQLIDLHNEFAAKGEGFPVDIRALDGKAIPVPTTADGLIDFAKTLFFTVDPTDLTAYRDSITTTSPSTTNPNFAAGALMAEGSILYVIDLYNRAKTLDKEFVASTGFATDIQGVVNTFNASINGATVANSGVNGQTLKITFVP